MHDGLMEHTVVDRPERGRFAAEDQLLPWADPYIADLARQHRVECELTDAAAPARSVRLKRNPIDRRSAPSGSWRHSGWKVSLASA